MYADTLGWQFYLSELLNRQCRIRIPQNKGALSAIISSIYKKFEYICMENLNAFDIFKEEIETDDTSVRINAIHKIPIVATLMTPDAIKNQLIPYLDSIQSDYSRSLQEIG